MNNITDKSSDKYYDISDEKATVLELQRMLFYLSLNTDLPRIYPDGVYDTKTEQAVLAFQEQSSLPATGRVDYATWTRLSGEYASLVERNAPPLRASFFPGPYYVTQPGERTSVVAVIQIMLNDVCRHLPITEADITGEYDEGTMEAVKNFQSLHSLPQTGLVDKKTWDFMTLDHHNYEIKQQA